MKESMIDFRNNSVELVGYYGSDKTHALSAWTSNERELTDEKQTRLGKFLKFLAQNGHHTPFEKSTLHFLVNCDTASHIHFLKHRIGVSVNGESARYKELKEDKCYIPQDWDNQMLQIYTTHINRYYELYHAALEQLERSLGRKRAKESARYFLPYSNQLTLDVTFNFRSFMHFQKLRNADDAQEEIHNLAFQMLYLIRNTGMFNLSLDAFGH